jgi:serine/threonine protein kinase
MVFDEEMGIATVGWASTTATISGLSMHTITPISPNKSSDASTAATSITGTFGDIKDKYCVITHVLGSGYHASVRECIDRATGVRYAVKTFYKSDPRVLPECIAREATLLRGMEHGSIVRLVDVFEDDVCIHLVTDLCKGGELFDKIYEKASYPTDGAACFTEGEAKKVMSQILNAVRYMHDHDVVHRDLKPENILFKTADEDSPVKIIDFGLARTHNAREAPMSNVAGTPYYIAPEVLRRQYDRSCDLWSVGVIAYVLLAGYPPFNGKDDDEVHRAILGGRYCFPPGDWRGTSREALDFIRRLMQMDTRKRMTAEQALCHPWITGAVTTDEDGQSEEAIDEGSRIRNRTIARSRS